MHNFITELNILVIEDNPGDFLLIQEYLEENYSTSLIRHAKNFKEAKSELTFTSVHFDIILLDLSLPDKVGEALITEIVSLSAGSIVIVLTGYENIGFSVKSLAIGAADYLVKDEINASSLCKSIVYNIERKKTNLKLEESEKRYSELFHLSPQPMWVYALDTLEFLDVNKVAEEHYGYSREEFLTMTIRDIRPAEDIPIVEEAIKVLKKEVGSITQATYRHKKKNGEIIKVDVKACVILFKERTAEIIVINDVTRISSYIEAIQDQNEKLREIAWIQSHIVRAPLARVMALTTLIKSSPDDDIEKDHLLQLLMESANDLDEIIRDISNKTYAANVQT